MDRKIELYGRLLSILAIPYTLKEYNRRASSKDRGSQLPVTPKGRPSNSISLENISRIEKVINVLKNMSVES